MISVYADLTEEAYKEANYLVSCMVELAIIDRDEEYDHLFPAVIYETRKEECRKVIKDIAMWAEDEFNHRLPTSLHEYALYSIFHYNGEIDQDTKKFNNGESILFTISNKVEDDEDLDKIDYTVNDIQNIDFYIENYFEDHDFLYVPLLISQAELVGIKKIENDYGIDFESFRLLMPPDVEQEFFSNYQKGPIENKAEILVPSSKVNDVVDSSIKHFKHMIEFNGSQKLLWDDYRVPKDEKAVQMLFFTMNYRYLLLNDIDLSAEPQSGRGLVDFKCSRGNERILIEIKLASHKKVKEGLSKQLVHYLKAEEIKEAFFIVVAFEEEDMVVEKELHRTAQRIETEEEVRIKVVVINATRNKTSPSKL